MLYNAVTLMPLRLGQVKGHISCVTLESLVLLSENSFVGQVIMNNAFLCKIVPTNNSYM